MQIWIFFEPGVGGDGFANLLEKSTDIEPIDGETGYWRVHRIVDGRIKFYAPTPDQEECFRSSLKPFRQCTNRLRKGYLDIVSDNKNCVITSHDVTLSNLRASDYQDIFCHDQIKVLLTGDIIASRWIAATKNLQTHIPPDVVQQKTVDLSQFDYVYDIRDLQQDWQLVKKFCDSFGIQLDKSHHDQYLSLLAGNRDHLNNNYNVEIYQSRILDDHIEYDRIDVWQPVD
jgi:hypothetical protein